MSELAMTKHRDRFPKIAWMWFLFWAFVLFFYFYGLTIPLVGPDEPRYAQVAREMFERGDWITPTLGGFDWFEKPVLLYWLQICSYKLFGVTEFSARFGSALFGLGTIASLLILGKRTCKSITSNASGPISGANPGAWLALMAATTLGVIAFSRGASFDIIVTFPITASLVSFFVWDLRHQVAFGATAGEPLFSWIPLFLCYFFAGTALLAKGLIGIVFPFGIIAVYFMVSRRWPERQLLFSLIWGTFVSIAVASTWYLPALLLHGYRFFDEFFIQQQFLRFTTNKYQHPQPFYFFLWVLPLLTIPWMPFFVAGAWKAGKAVLQGFVREQTASAQSDVYLSIQRFAIAWLLVPLVFFSFSGSKLPGYILPAVPAAILLAWLFVLRPIQDHMWWQKGVAVVGVVTLLGSAILLATVVPRYADGDSVKRLIASANAQGYADEKVLILNSPAYNAEFYAAGRLLRDESGNQRRFYSAAEIRKEMESEDTARVLVLVPIGNEPVLTRSTLLDSRILSDNGELAIALVQLK